MKIAKHLFSFYWKAVTVHQIQAPLAYELCYALVEDDRFYYAFDAFEQYSKPKQLRQLFRLLHILDPQRPFVLTKEKFIHFCHQAALGNASFQHESPDYIFFFEKNDLKKVEDNQWIVIADYWKNRENLDKVEDWLARSEINIVIQTSNLLIFSKQTTILAPQYLPVVSRRTKFWKLGLWQK